MDQNIQPELSYHDTVAARILYDTAFNLGCMEHGDHDLWDKAVYFLRIGLLRAEAAADRHHADGMVKS